MKRSAARKTKVAGDFQPESPAEAAERAGYGPKISLERGYLTLRWKKEQGAEALDSEGMTLEQVLVRHLVPRLDATKTVNIKYCGVITATFEQPDWDIQLKMLKLALQLHGALPAE
jgi:hypothetical protein